MCHDKVQIKVEETFNGVEFWGVNSVKKDSITSTNNNSSEQYTYIVIYSIILY